MELTVRERLSIAISRELRDGEVVLTGAASAVPLAACLLAQARHAPALTILGAGVYINPRRLVPAVDREQRFGGRADRVGLDAPQHVVDHRHPLAAVRKQDGELGGRFVGWTGFMPVRGPLQIEDMWSRGIVLPETGQDGNSDDAGEITHEPGPRLAALTWVRVVSKSSPE